MSYSYYLIHGATLKGVATVLGVLLPDVILPDAVLWLLLPPVFYYRQSSRSLGLSQQRCSCLLKDLSRCLNPRLKRNLNLQMNVC
jgi:hypothetical protein